MDSVISHLVVTEVARNVAIAYPDATWLDREREQVEQTQLSLARALGVHLGQWGVFCPRQDDQLLTLVRERGRPVDASTPGAVVALAHGGAGFSVGPRVVECVGARLASAPLAPSRYTGAWTVPGLVYPRGL